MNKVLSVNDSFWAKIEKIPNGCWLWRGSVTNRGYGQIGIRQSKVSAHRMSWLINKGEITNNLLVLHKCDNPICVNPDHLYLGTQKDNVRDREERCKYPIGRIRKLNWNKVRKIRNAYKQGLTTMANLSQQFGVCAATICYIVNNKIWIEP